MLKENFSEKDELNVVNTIKGEDLKIDDVLVGDFKDCLGLIIRDIHFDMEKKKFYQIGRVNVFEPIKNDDYEVISNIDEKDIGLFSVFYSSDDKTSALKFSLNIGLPKPLLTYLSDVMLTTKKSPIFLAS